MAPEVSGEAARRGGVIRCRAFLPHFRPTLPQKRPNTLTHPS